MSCYIESQADDTPCMAGTIEEIIKTMSIRTLNAYLKEHLRDENYEKSVFIQR